jgi:hypothetical protein
MRKIRTSGSMSGDGKRSVAAWPKLPRPSSTLPKEPAAKRQRMSVDWDSSDLDGKVGPCVAILVYTADRLSRSKPKGLVEPVHLGRRRKAGGRSVSGIGTSAPLREDRGKLAIC